MSVARSECSSPSPLRNITESHSMHHAHDACSVDSAAGPCVAGMDYFFPPRGFFGDGGRPARAALAVRFGAAGGANSRRSNFGCASRRASVSTPRLATRGAFPIANFEVLVEFAVCAAPFDTPAPEGARLRKKISSAGAATAFTTAGTTALPNWRYACVSLTTMGSRSGNPISRAASLGVSRRGFEAGCGISTSDPSL